MNEKEKQVMLEHVTDLKSFADKGTVIVIGPVMDPEGPGDLAVADAESGRSQINDRKKPTRLSRSRFQVGVVPILLALVRA